jgi:hypothetical protein
MSASIDASEGIKQKVYISSHDLKITDNGIFLCDCYQVDAVFSDDQGLYVITGLKESEISDNCINGHPIWCRNCNGCANPWCFRKCRCVVCPWSMK